MNDFTDEELNELWDSLDSRADYIHHYLSEYVHYDGNPDAFYSMQQKVRDECKRRGYWWAK